MARSSRVRAILGVGAVGGLVASLLFGSISSAHTPHDAIGTIVTSPDYANDQTVYVRAEQRLLKSIDAGATWETLLNGTPASIRDLAISAADTDRLYATAEGALFRSDDGGSRWRQTELPSGADPWKVEASATDPDTAVVVFLGGGVEYTEDGGDTWTSTPLQQVSVLASARGATDLLVAGFRDGSIQTSNDDGRTWSDPATVIAGAVRSLHVTASDPSIVYAGGDGGLLHRSEDDGRSFSPVGDGLPGEEIRGVVVDASGNSERVWVSTYTTGIWHSDNGGSTWSERTQGLTTDIQADNLERAQFSQVALGPSDRDDPDLFLAGFDGLFSSVNGGSSWSETQVLADHITGLSVSPNFAQDQTLAVSSYVKGAFLSSNAGEDFQFSVEGLRLDEVTAGNELLPVLRLHSIAFSPDFANDDIVFSASWTQVLRSLDGGAQWERSFVSDPPAETRLRLFIIEPSPDFANDATLFVGSRQGEIFRSTSQGESGSFELMARLEGRVRDLAISSTFSSDRTLFATTDAGVFRSTDGGENWAIVAEEPASLLALSPALADDGVAFVGTNSGLLVSRDGGEAWTRVDDEAVGNGRIEGLAVAPTFADDEFMVVSVRAEGLFRSNDGGLTFERVAPELLEQNILIADFFTNPSGTPMHFSPDFADDRTILAYAETRVMRSTDAGESWTALTLPTWRDFPHVDDHSSNGETDDPPIAGDVVDIDEVTPPPVEDSGGGGRSGTPLVGLAALVGVLGFGALVVRRGGRTTVSDADDLDYASDNNSTT